MHQVNSMSKSCFKCMCDYSKCVEGLERRLLSVTYGQSRLRVKGLENLSGGFLRRDATMSSMIDRVSTLFPWCKINKY